MAQRVRRKKDRSSVKGVAIKRTKGQTVKVERYGNVTSIEVVSGGKDKKDGK